ncbi:MAG TPA: flagellar basal body-associated FliL family protein [Dongiaceae bacterium]|nr:flagellar basal body-associated FliL family protein [Dongiaceae bacterium]
MKTLFTTLSLLLALTLTSSAQASGGGEAKADPEGVAYVELSPAFVTNFVSPKIRYLKADVTLKVKGSATADAVNRHQPFIRNNLVMLFSRQEEEALNSPEGRQHLKEEALQEVINALQAESEPVEVQEVLFTSFIVD